MVFVNRKLFSPILDYSQNTRRLFFFLFNLSLFFSLLFTIIIPKVSASSSFSISNTTPFLGEQITITGSGLIPNHTYYLYNYDGGPEKDYTDTTYQGETAKQYTGTLEFGTGWSYSHAYDEFENVLVFIRYYDAVAATPYFRIGASDIYWSNGGGYAQTVDVDSTGSSSWVTWTKVFDKDKGVPSFEWRFLKVGSNNVYVDKIQKYPMWTVTTDALGSFSKTIHAPRTYNRDVTLSFTFKLFDPNDNSHQAIGSITLDPKYDQYRSVKDMLEFHYIHNRPEVLEGNYGGVFANQIRKSILNYKGADWDNAFMGGVFDELGYPELRNEQAERTKDTIRTGTSDLRCYPLGAGNYTDCTFAGWTTIKPAYEETGDISLYNAMGDILSYSRAAYNVTYDNFSHSSGAGSEFWIDAGGGKPQFFWYMGKLLNNDTYKSDAIKMINTMIDKLQTPEGWFYQRYNYATDTINGPIFWDGGQGWALNGLREFKDLIENDTTQQSLVTKISDSLVKLADNLADRPITDLRSDQRRSSIISYNLLKLAQDTSYPQSKRNNWQKRGEELFILEMKTKNSDYDTVNKYGLTYSSTSDFTFAFSDYYLLELLNDIYPTAYFFPNNIGSSYLIDKSTGGNSIYQAYLDNTNDWTKTTDYYNRVSSAGNVLKGTAQHDRVVKYVKRDMTATVTSGNVDITIEDWRDNYRKWRMASDTNQSVDIVFSNLPVNKTFYIFRDDSLWRELKTDGGGSLSFTYDEGFSTHTFVLKDSLPSADSSQTVPSPSSSVCSALTPGEKVVSLYAALAKDAETVELYFTDAQDPYDHYVLQYGTKSGEYQFGVENIGGKGTRTYTVKGLSPNTTYYFRVRAGNGCATGEWSNEISAKTLGVNAGNNPIVFSELKPVGGNEKEKKNVCQTYTVQAGDGLWEIAEKILGDGNRYKELIEKNKQKYPSLEKSNNVEPGWILTTSCSQGKTQQENTDQSDPQEQIGSDQKTYDLTIQVIDTNKKPVGGASVTVHSTPRTGTTDKDGWVTFEDVEAGQHRVIISYGNVKGEQSINLDGDVKKQELTIQVKPAGISGNPYIMTAAGFLLAIVVGSFFIFFRKKRVRRRSSSL